MDLIEITNNTNRHPWETARKIIVNKFIWSLRKKNNKILDVGSGDAFVANGFTKKFPNSHSYCVDTGYTSALINKIENIFKNSNLNLYRSLSDVEVNTIDIVTLLDVIEHVPNDVDFLNNIIRQPYITNDTFYIITVPAYQTLFSGHDEKLKHYRRYNLQKLKETVNKCDLKFIDSGYFFSILIIPRIIELVIEKTSSKKNKDSDNLGTWEGGKMTSAIIKNILLFDYKIGRMFKLFGINFPGLSCYVICQKQ
ncbi:methyltransferase domain-containing protein [Candidatus Venteria ishoeyi]|uniref:Bifunctional 3-demethylubiquinone-9 3-methyltransferase/ 2-octaprenyl-6-hydroxy phenol methylase n=1 Tax=Candidatus Venteria ishoeyi TaxID=1899563 RepID=A0A1H6F7J6_9GAMM|nr:class I SAM-dependent methyltransferase [Candidatus Venteria ishoeyi]SEH05289.1 Uncharacterised protein [Candidatus Venteria ishoeyi]